MKKTLAIFASVSVALFPVALRAEETHYYLRGSDTPLSEIVAGTPLFEKYGIDWTGRYSVALGAGPGDGRSGTVGTAVFVKAPASGTMLIMR